MRRAALTKREGERAEHSHVCVSSAGARFASTLFRFFLLVAFLRSLFPLARCDVHRAAARFFSSFFFALAACCLVVGRCLHRRRRRRPLLTAAAAVAAIAAIATDRHQQASRLLRAHSPRAADAARPSFARSTLALCASSSSSSSLIVVRVRVSRITASSHARVCAIDRRCSCSRTRSQFARTLENSLAASRLSFCVTMTKLKDEAHDRLSLASTSATSIVSSSSSSSSSSSPTSAATKRSQVPQKTHKVFVSVKFCQHAKHFRFRLLASLPLFRLSLPPAYAQ